MPHPGWRAHGVSSSHFYVSFLQRWRLIATALTHGYVMLSLDTDILWTADPLARALALPADAVFAVDEVPPQPRPGAQRIPLNSGVMLGRPRAHRLFAEVARRVHACMVVPPNHSLVSKHPRSAASELTVMKSVWPQGVLNEVVAEWRRSEWLASQDIDNGTATITMISAASKHADSPSGERLSIRVGVLSHRTVSRLCGRRINERDVETMWGQALIVVNSTSPQCSLSVEQRGFHAQMAHPHTRRALWAVLHPTIRSGDRAALLSAALNAGNGSTARSRFPAVAFSSTLAGATCICRPGIPCRWLRGVDSYKTALKRCKYWDLGA